MSTIQLISSCSFERKDFSSNQTHSLSPSAMRKPTTNHFSARNVIQKNKLTSPQSPPKAKHHKLPTSHRKKKMKQKQNENVLLSNGYRKQKTIAPSLQGEVLIALKTAQHSDSLLVCGYIRYHMMPHRLYSSIIPEIMKICYRYMQDETCVVIKSADKKLHCKGISKTSVGQIKEDIVKEASLLKVFGAHEAPKSMIKYCDFLEDETHYYLVMEHGGTGLFEFVVECHELIANGQLSIKEWKRAVRFMFGKMVQVMEWMHTKAHCCNLDLSLENIVMGRETHFDAHTGTIKQLEIRFIDFGVAELFDVSNEEFICNKFVGKSGYKAPKVFNMKQFCANKADVWSLGMCLFMMSIGAPIYKAPISTDPGFKILKDGQLMLMLQCWSRLDYIGKHQFDLLTNMLCIDERKRYSIGDVMKHEWIQSYFKKDGTAMSERGKRKSHSKAIKNEIMSSLHCDLISLQNKGNRTPSIKESETVLFEHDAFCAAVEMDCDDR